MSFKDGFPVLSNDPSTLEPETPILTTRVKQISDQVDQIDNTIDVLFVRLSLLVRPAVEAEGRDKAPPEATEHLRDLAALLNKTAVVANKLRSLNDSLEV